MIAKAFRVIFFKIVAQGQGFVAIINWKFAGYLNNLELALTIEIILSSIGSLSDCKIDFWNFNASSSKNKTPLCASDTLPGSALGLQPIIPSLLAV